MYRAEKDSLASSMATPENVGPGAYNLARSYSANPAPAPFHSSDLRLSTGASASNVPGVGAYDSHQALDALSLRRVDPTGFTKNFASTVPRLAEDNSRAYVPGPGSYAEGNAWIKRSHRYSAPAAKQRLSYQKVPTAPSIPAQNQSFGYEEDKTGELVLQKPSDPVHTGEGIDKVGPGSYDVPLTLIGSSAAQKGTGWGISRTKRDNSSKNNTPGPGAYNPQVIQKQGTNAIVVSINGVDVQFGGASGTSQFASRVPLPANRQAPDHEQTPGPGSYAVDDGLSNKTTKKPPREMQFFGATTKRQSQIDPTKSLSAPTYFKNPGPGAYEETRRAVSVRKSLSDPQPFLSTASRFQSGDGKTPGPGEYKPDYTHNMVKEMEDRAAMSRGGVFGSTATRFGSTSMSAGSQPGPGNYDPGSDKNKIVTNNETSNFTSRTQRFKPAKAPPAAIDTSDQSMAAVGIVKGDPSRLGPGSYLERDTWCKPQRHPGYKKAAFGSDAGRGSVVRSAGTPGPGRYNNQVDMNKVYRPFSVPAKETVFGVQADRFKGSSTISPGPGAYSTSGDVVKKSFNITFMPQEV